MTKVKKHVSKVEIEDTDLEYPIYLYWQDEHSINDFYSKITEEKWINISFKLNEGIKIEVIPHSPKRPIAEYWFNHLIDKYFWDGAVKELDEYFKIIKDE